MTKSLEIAMILALFSWGFGHIYLGYMQRGFFLLIIAIILAVQIVVSPSNAIFGILILAALAVWCLADVYQLYKKDEVFRVKEEFSCSKCGFKNGLTSEFCIKCGSKVQNSCLKCGQLTNSQMTFCGKCGTALTV